MPKLPEQIVRYQPYDDGRSGLSLQNGQLTAWLGGRPVGQASTAGSDLAEVLADYRALRLFPKLGFAYTTPRHFRVELTPVPGLPDEFTCRLSLDGEDALAGEDMLAFAEYVSDPVFGHVAEVPHGQVCHDEPSDQGWLIHLPGPIITHPDPVLRKRCGQAVEHYLHAIGTGREVSTPYAWHFTNVMDAAHPMWQLNLPRLALAAER